MILDYTTNDNRKLPNTSTLSLGGGTIVLKEGTATENFIQGGSSYFSTDAGTFFVRDGGTAKINLNAILITTSQAQAVGRFSVVSFSHDNMATTDRPNTAGILGAWFTVGNRWAANSDPAVFPTAAVDGNIVGYTGGTAFGGVSNSLDINYDLVGGFTMTSARSVNTLRIESNGDDQVLNLGAHILSMSNHGGTGGTGQGSGSPTNLTGSAGGLLYAGGANGNYTINGTTGSLRLESQNGQAMLVNVHSGTLTVNTTIGSGSSAFVKSGEGTLVLGGTHSNSGAFRVYQGVVRVKSNAAYGNYTGAASVQNGAALELDGASILSSSRPLTITGEGISNGGALRNVATTGSYAPAITLGAGGARINSDTGTLTLTGGIVTAGNTVTFGGAGNTTVSTAAISGTGGLVKDGEGTTTLSAANSYSGITTINGGSLVMGANNVIPDASNVSIGTATLDADNRTDTAGTLDVTSSAVINLSTGTALAFADSKAVDWTGGTLNVTGTLGATSLRFGDSADDLTPTQLALISVNGSGAGTYILDAEGYLIPAGGGDTTPPTLTSITDNISGGPLTVGNTVTYTVTFNEDIDAASVTAADFDNNGTADITVGTITETSPGVFTVAVTANSPGTLKLRIPTGAVIEDVALNDLVVPVEDDTTITVQTQYQAWAGGALFDADANADGVSNGLAFALGASGPGVNAVSKLPTVTETAGGLVMTFEMLNAASRGTVTLSIEHSSDLGIGDAWEAALVPDVDSTVNDLVFDLSGSSPLGVQAIIPVSKANGGKLFGRLKAVQP